jgi:hypothetical protein
MMRVIYGRNGNNKNEHLEKFNIRIAYLARPSAAADVPTISIRVLLNASNAIHASHASQINAFPSSPRSPYSTYDSQTQ